MNLDQDLIVLTSDIAAKYCEGSSIRVEDVPKLITGIHGAIKAEIILHGWNAYRRGLKRTIAKSVGHLPDLI